MVDAEATTKTRRSCLKWSKIVSIGSKPDLDIIANFKFKDLLYRKDYSIIRSAKVLRDDSLFRNDFTDIFCQIHVSPLGKPLFECKVPALNKSFIANTPTSVANTVLSFLGHKKKWSGIEFFGFRRQDVVAAISESEHVGGISEEQDHTTTVSINESSDMTSHKPHTFLSRRKKAIKQSWVGVMSIGIRELDERYIYNAGEKKLYLQPGFISMRDVTVNNETFRVYNKIIEGEAGPEFVCYTTNGIFKSKSTKKPTTAVNEIQEMLGLSKWRNWSGFEFFGLNRHEVIDKLLYHASDDFEPSNPEKKIRGNANAHPELVKIARIYDRNAGKTEDLIHKKSQTIRNEAIHDVVKLASQDDVKGYISYLCKAHPELIFEGIDNCDDEDFSHLMSKFEKSTKPISVNASEVAPLLLGDCQMSQRKYKNLRRLLKKNNVKLPKYENVSSYAKALDVGSIKLCDKCSEKCMGCTTSLKETLQKIVSSELYNKMEFKSEGEQNALFSFLKEKDPIVYEKLDPVCKTIILRQTGDNFRASARMPTEQISFSMLNIKDMVNNPYGQFINALWRGPECRSGLETHMKAYIEELELLSLHGVDLLIGDEMQHFNLIYFLVVDIGLLEKILGKCSSTSMYGCYWCDMKKTKWDVIGDPDGKQQSVRKMHENGLKAIKELGENPSHTTKKFTSFMQTNLSQHSPPMLQNLIIEVICPCSLHCILAHHRYLWKFLFNVISNRNQESDIPSSLREIGCDYLAYQYECYLKSKQKCYDGSGTLRMIGSDCKQLEDNIDKFLVTFLKEKESYKSKSFEKFRQISVLYHDFKELALDMRTTTFNEERTNSFESRAIVFLKKLKNWAGGSSTFGLPYLHIMTRHIGKSMKIWGKFLRFGYGYFCCTAGEHLNKRLKVMEVNCTNLDKLRFATVIRSMRSKQFFYVDTIYHMQRDMHCSRCHQEGHNRKNKCCPLHPSQPQIEFDVTDDEN